MAAGAFRLGIDGPGARLRLVEWGVGIRSRLLGRPYGDQAIFMTAETFRACGGFPPLPEMEDYAMLSRLRRRGRIRISPAAVRTSARTWLRDGVIRRTLRNQWKILKFRWGRFRG